MPKGDERKQNHYLGGCQRKVGRVVMRRYEIKENKIKSQSCNRNGQPKSLTHSLMTYYYVGNIYHYDTMYLVTASVVNLHSNHGDIYYI